MEKDYIFIYKTVGEFIFEQNLNMKKAEVWLNEAKWDLKNAHILFYNQRYNTVIFLSQQAAEKAVNALLFSED